MKQIQISTVVILLFLLFGTVFGQDDILDLSPYNVIKTAWNNYGNMYALGRVDGSIYIYENTDSLTIIENAHTNWVNGLSFSPDNSKIATTGYDNSIRVWDILTGNLIKEFNDISQSVQTVIWGKDGNTIWVLSFVDNASIISVDLATDTYLIVDTLPIGTGSQPSINLQNTSMAVGGLGLDIILINTSDSTIYRDLDATRVVDPVNPPNEFTTSVAWHPTSNRVVNGKVNGWIHVWDLDSLSDNTPILSLQANENVVDDAIIPFEYQVKSVSYSNDGTKINSVSADGTFRTWDSESGTLLADVQLAEFITSAAFSPDGNQLVYTPLSTVEIPPIVTTTQDIICSVAITDDCLDAPILTSISDTVDTTPTFTWSAVSGTESYLLSVSSTSTSVQESFVAANICNPTECSGMLSQPLTPDTYSASVQGANATATSEWSNVESFTILPTVSCDTNVVTGNTSGLISAINSANSNPDATTICLEDGTYTFTTYNNTQNGRNALPRITTDVTIVGNGAVLERDASSYFRFFYVTSSGSLTLDNLTLSNGDGGSVDD